MEHQDWKPVVISSKKNSNNKDSNNKTSIGYTTPKYKEDEIGMPIKKDLPKNFGQKMQQARSAKGWTQKELAQKLNVTQVTVQKYEQNSVTNPNRTFARRIEKVLDADLF